MNKLYSLMFKALIPLLLLGFTSCETEDGDNEDDFVEVTHVTLDETKLTIYAGEIHFFTATVYPIDATNKWIEWSSDNEDVATAQDNMITAVAPGKAKITVTALNGEHTATCDLTVIPVLAQGINFDYGHALLATNMSLTITPTIYPEDTTDKSVVWASTNPSVATVENGVVTALAEGEATISATTNDGEFAAECLVEVTPHFITVTTQEQTYHANLTLSGAGGITIDWGDGTIEFASIDHTANTYTHEYEGTEENVITLTGYEITFFSCSSSDNNRPNNIIRADIGNYTALEIFHCSDNMLTSLDVSKNTELREFHCSFNQLTSLDVSKNTFLEELGVSSNQLTTLNIGNNSSLVALDCSNNKLKTLHVSYSDVMRPGGYRGMHRLNCSDNELETLTLTKGSISGEFNVSNNKLTELDLSEVSVGGYVRLFNNLFEDTVLDAIFTGVHRVVQGKNILYIGGNPGTDTCDKTIATNKGWEVHSGI